MRQRDTSWRAPSTYRLRVLGGGVVALLLCVAFVRWWPTPQAAPHASYSDFSDDRVQLEEIQPTDHDVRRQPPPPAPLPPVVVPNDVVVNEQIDWSDTSLDIVEPGDDAERRDGQAEEAVARAQPATTARLLRAPQPTYTEAARSNDIRARVAVLVQVSARGVVQDATIRARWRVNASGEEQPTATLGYGLDEAALEAARRARFRPARDAGQPVPTETVITFRFGPR
jgi:hypothetical protein